MDETFVIVGPDGTEHEFPVGMDPKKAAGIVRGDGGGSLLGNAWQDVKDMGSGVLGLLDSTSGLIPRAAMAAQDEKRQQRAASDADTRTNQQRDAEALSGMRANAAGPEQMLRSVGEEFYQHPVRTLAAAAPMLPIARAAARPVASAAKAAATSPIARGAARVPGALAVDLAERALPRTTDVVRGIASSMKKAAAPAKAPTAAPAAAMVPESMASSAPLLDALMRGASFDELSALVKPKTATAATRAATGASALEAELMARQALEKPINWRTQDVTPIRKPGPGIHFGEESTPGLLKLLQDALLAKNKPLADQIQTAIRQRSHITGKVGG